MGSNFYLMVPGQVPEDVLRDLKQERGLNPEEVVDGAEEMHPLYLVGKRHAPNPYFSQCLVRALDEGNLSPELTKDVEKILEDCPNFTLTFRRSLFDRLGDEVRLSSPYQASDAPSGIHTVGDLRALMAQPGYRVKELPNADIS